MKKHNPRWRGAVEGYAVKQCCKFLPRMLPAYDLDDLYNEAFIVFVKCCNESIATGDAHFMAFFSTCLHNRFMNLAESARKGYGDLSIENLDLDEDLPLVQRTLPEGELAVAISRMPSELLAQIMSLINSSKSKHARGTPLASLRTAVERYLMS